MNVCVLWIHYILKENTMTDKMADSLLQLKGFLVVWKVLKQSQPKRDLMREKYIKQHKNGEITKDEFETIYPEGIKVALEIQKKRNMERFHTALWATSDDRFERAKRLNWKKIAQLRGDLTNKTV